MAKMYAAIHRDVSPPIGTSIDFLARVHMPDSDWCMPEGPATHAFLWWDAGYRLDAQPGGAVLSALDPWKLPTRSWHLPTTEVQGAEILARCAKPHSEGGFVGMPYDFGEALAQFIPGLWDASLHPGRMICTNMTIAGMELAGYFVKPAHGNRHPEALGRLLRSARDVFPPA
jgi:hypothetical protein